MRFFCADMPETPNVIVLDRKESHHLRRVVRLREGHLVKVINGCGTEALGAVRFRDEHTVIVEVQSIRFVGKPDTHCILGCAVPENKDTMAAIIRYAVELGVSSISLIASRYSGVRKSGNIIKYMDRWQNVMIGASKQCGALWLPTIQDPVALDVFFESLPAGVCHFVGCEPGIESDPVCLDDMLPCNAGISWIVGPEGGWSPEDRDLIKLFKPYYLQVGSLTLTSQVAAVTGLAILKTHFRLWH